MLHVDLSWRVRAFSLVICLASLAMVSGGCNSDLPESLEDYHFVPAAFGAYELDDKPLVFPGRGPIRVTPLIYPDIAFRGEERDGKWIVEDWVLAGTPQYVCTAAGCTCNPCCNRCSSLGYKAAGYEETVVAWGVPELPECKAEDSCSHCTPLVFIGYPAGETFIITDWKLLNSPHDKRRHEEFLKRRKSEALERYPECKEQEE